MLLEAMVNVLKKELMTGNAEPFLLRRKDVGAFLRRCDQQLIASLGANQFSTLIAGTGLSLGQWTKLN